MVFLQHYHHSWMQLPECLEADTNYVIHKTLSVVHREGSVLCRNEVIMFDDLDMGQILPLVIAVIRNNLGNFIQELLTKASSMQLK